jgi:F420-non-reducing hydrogenase iron-sulfur subunit
MIAGIMPERFALDWASAAEAPLFVKLITKFTNQIEELGPLGEAEGMTEEELNLKLSAARSAVKNAKLRLRFGRLAQELRQGDPLAPHVVEEKVALMFNDSIVHEIEKLFRADNGSSPRNNAKA